MIEHQLQCVYAINKKGLGLIQEKGLELEFKGSIIGTNYVSQYIMTYSINKNECQYYMASYIF